MTVAVGVAVMLIHMICYDDWKRKGSSATDVVEEGMRDC